MKEYASHTVQLGTIKVKKKRVT